MRARPRKFDGPAAAIRAGALGLIMCMMTGGAALGQARSADPYAWQKAPVNVNPLKERLAGLDLLVDLDVEPADAPAPGQPASPGGASWPRLVRQASPCTARHADAAIHEPDPADFYTPITLGQVRVPGTAEPKLRRAGRTWCYGMLDVICTGQGADAQTSTLRITTSRLSPGVLIGSSAGLTLFAGQGQAGIQPPGDALPAWFAVPGKDGVVIRPAESVSELPLDQLGAGWMLAWFGQGSYFKGVKSTIYLKTYNQDTFTNQLYPADCPLLILFSQAPRSLKAGKGEGLTIDFAGPGQVVVLPLMGEKSLPAEQTENWKDGLPKDVIDRCDWWGAHMSRFPLEARESYSYDVTTDTVTITESIEFRDFRPAGTMASPVPPMIASAAADGFPVSFTPDPDDPKLSTSAGPYRAVPGVTSYQMRFTGLGKYVSDRPAPGESAAPKALTDELQEQVRRILDAGHLAPWFRVRKLCDGWAGGFIPQTAHLVHANPGEVLYFLAEVMPLLPAELQEQVRGYLRRERAEYPPEKISLLLGGQGARREEHALSAAFLADEPALDSFNNINHRRAESFYVSHKLIPDISLYYLAAYYRAVGPEGLSEAWPDIQAIRTPYLRQMDWATGSTHRWPGAFAPYSYQGHDTLRPMDRWYGMGGVVDVNHAFAASIGQIRLARLAKDSQGETLAWGLFARTAALRFALGKMPASFYRQGLMGLCPGQTSPEQDIRPAFFLDEYGVGLRLWTYDDMGLALLHDAVPELGAFTRDHLAAEAERYFGSFERGLPAWYLAWNEQTLDGESNRLMPQDVYQTFMAHAWIFQSPPQWLERHLDLPWQPRGDLYYLSKLAETIRAYQRQ